MTRLLESLSGSRFTQNDTVAGHRTTAMSREKLHDFGRIPSPESGEDVSMLVDRSLPILSAREVESAVGIGRIPEKADHP